MQRHLRFLALLTMSCWASGPALAADAKPPLELKFTSFFQLPVGSRGLEIAEALRAADGREVRLRGYMVAQEQPAAGRFWLTPRPLRMSEHADGEADDLPPNAVAVLLDPAQRERIVAHREGPIALSGRLSVGRSEDPATGRVSWVRLQLAPDSLAEAPVAAAAHAH